MATPNYASLASTLSGMDAATLEEALFSQQMDERTQIAQQAAEAVGQQYQQAAAAPPPEAPDSFVSDLMSNVASVIARDPAFRERAEKEKQAKNQALLQARSQNLQALRDVYSQRAEAAQRAGDLQQQEEFRLKHEKISKQLDLMGQAETDQRRHEQDIALERERQRGRGIETEAEHRARLAEIAAQAAEQRRRDQEKPKASPSERAALTRQGIHPDTGLTLSTFGDREVTRRLALAKKGDRASRDEAVNGALDIATKRWNTDKTPMAMARRIISIKHPFYGIGDKDARYALTDKKIYRRGRKGEPKYVRDEDNAKEVAARAKEIVQPWFEE